MRFGVYDFETYDLGGGIAGIGVYDGEHYTYCGTDVNALIDVFEQSDITIWYAHNGGQYDVKYLIDAIKDRYYVKYMLINASLSLKAYKNVRERKRKSKTSGEMRIYKEMQTCLFELRDSVLLMPDKLSRLSASFGVEHQKQDYDDYKEHKDKARMREYLEYDCLALYDILKAFESELGFDKLWLTSASTAMNVFKSTFGGVDWLKRLGRNRDIYREGYYGGRTEVFTRYGTDLNYYDVNSLYPAPMHNEQFPLGYPLSTTHRDRDCLGYYRITAECPDLEIPLLPFRQDKKLIFPSGTFSGWYYSPEIDLAEELGYRITIHEGYEWLHQCNPFKEYVDYYYKIKQDSTGPKRYLAKLMLNALYGKFAQREEGLRLIDTRTITAADLEEHDIYMYPNEEDIAYMSCKRYSDFIKPHISGFITCYGRCYLYRYMLKAGLENIYYCDTDSIITSSELKSGIGTGLGEMKLEARIDEGYFLLPKVYAFRNDKDEVTIRAKGLSVEQLRYEDFKPALSGDYSHIRSEIKRVMGIRQKLRSGYEGNWYDTYLLKKNIKGIFNKRLLLEDGIHTIPLSL